MMMVFLFFVFPVLSGNCSLLFQEAEQQAEDWQEVTHITCSVWPLSLVTPPSDSILLDLIEAAKPESGRPVVVHCRCVCVCVCV